MSTEDRILEMVKEKPLLMRELGGKLQLLSLEMKSAVAFLQKNGLVKLMPTNEGKAVVQITPSGLQLLNLPDLPEDELPSDQLKVLEKHWGDETDDIGRKWLFLMQLKNKISCELGRSQGTITIEQRNDKYILTAIIPKKDGVLHLQKEDISKCHYTTVETKVEVEELFQRRRGRSER